VIGNMRMSLRRLAGAVTMCCVLLACMVQFGVLRTVLALLASSAASLIASVLMTPRLFYALPPDDKCSRHDSRKANYLKIIANTVCLLIGIALFVFVLTIKIDGPYIDRYHRNLHLQRRI